MKFLIFGLFLLTLGSQVECNKNDELFSLLPNDTFSDCGNFSYKICGYYFDSNGNQRFNCLCSESHSSQNETFYCWTNCKDCKENSDLCTLYSRPKSKDYCVYNFGIAQPICNWHFKVIKISGVGVLIFVFVLFVACLGNYFKAKFKLRDRLYSILPQNESSAKSPTPHSPEDLVV